MKGSASVIIAVVLVQAALAGVYWMVDHRRSGDSPDEPLSTLPPVRVEGRMESVSVRDFDGTLVNLQPLERLTLIHFWATWCAPCRDELPGILDLADRKSLDVVAIAFDQDWANVERFLGGNRPANVFLGNSTEIETKLGVRSLPVTYLVQSDGRLRYRFDGARDWANKAFVQKWIGHD
jgi:thiol-disulfide isomerase/thioredoxin